MNKASTVLLAFCCLLISIKPSLPGFYNLFKLFLNQLRRTTAKLHACMSGKSRHHISNQATMM